MVWARPWPHDPQCAYLLITGGHIDSARLPRPETVNEWLRTLEMWGYRSVRTGALGPEMAATLRSAGFVPVQDLLLMSIDLTAHPVPAPPRESVRALRTWPRPGRHTVESVLAVDAASFDPVWSLDSSSFAEARQATARSRLFVATEGADTVGFVLTGATGQGGYIQRLAVLPGHRRRGHAVGLLAAAHSWLRARGCSTAVVNTETANAPAIDLYRRLGYAALPYGLQVLERPLSGGNPA